MREGAGSQLELRDEKRRAGMEENWRNDESFPGLPPSLCRLQVWWWGPILRNRIHRSMSWPADTKGVSRVWCIPGSTAWSSRWGPTRSSTFCSSFFSVKLVPVPGPNLFVAFDIIFNSASNQTAVPLCAPHTGWGPGHGVSSPLVPDRCVTPHRQRAENN